MKIVNTIRSIVTFVSAILLLTACTAETLPYTLPSERQAFVTQNEIDELRKTYPVNNDLSSQASMSFGHMQSWEDYGEFNETAAVVVLEITGELYEKDKQLQPFDTAEQNEGFPVVTITQLFTPARVLQVLEGNADLKGKDINLGWGSLGIVDPGNIGEIYQKDRVFVAILRPAPTSTDGVNNAFSLSEYATFYITDTGVVLPVTDFIACFNECEGMYVDTFTTTIKENLISSDAELTPVEPELQTE